MIDAIKTSTKDRMEKAMAALSGELKKFEPGGLRFLCLIAYELIITETPRH